MTDLTEQFENDEITKGSYYCKSKLDGHGCIAGFISNKGLFDCDYNGTLNKGYWEVLAKVPDYEEWQALNQNLDSTMQTNKALCKKLVEVKELLRIILSKIKICYSMVYQKDIINAEINEALLKKINEALK